METSNQPEVAEFEDFSGDLNLLHRNSSDDCETLALDIILMFSLLRVLSTVLNEQSVTDWVKIKDWVKITARMCALADLFTPGLCIGIVCPNRNNLDDIPRLLVDTNHQQNIPHGLVGHGSAIFSPKSRLTLRYGQTLDIHPPQNEDAFLPVLAVDGTILAPTVTPVFECKSWKELPHNLQNTRIYQRRLTYLGKPENIKFVRGILISNLALQHPDTGVVHEFLPCRQKKNGITEAGVHMSDIFNLNRVGTTLDFNTLILLDCSLDNSNEDSCFLPPPGLPDWVPENQQKQYITELTDKFAEMQNCSVTHDTIDEFYCDADGLIPRYYGPFKEHMKRSRYTCPDCIQIHTQEMRCTRTHNTAHIVIDKKKKTRKALVLARCSHTGKPRI
jgi:hypothetical protein